MDAAEILRQSRREHELYGTLLATYRALASALGDEAAPLDAARLAAAEVQAEETTAALRTLAATLGAHRLAGDTVPPLAEALWRESAALAAEALRVGATVAALARARQAGVTARIANLGAGRRGLKAYRPATRPAAAGVHA